MKLMERFAQTFSFISHNNLTRSPQNLLELGGNYWEAIGPSVCHIQVGPIRVFLTLDRSRMPSRG